MPNSYYYACFSCRKAFKRPAAPNVFERPCPICQGPAKIFGPKFKSPPARDKNAWKVVEYLRDRGFFYTTILTKAPASSPHLYVEAKYPVNLAEAEIFVEKFKAHANKPFLWELLESSEL